MTKAKSDRFVHFNRFVDRVAPHVRPSEFRVWIYLWRRANRAGQVAISYSDLAKAVGVSRQKIPAILTRLKDIGTLGIESGNNWKRHRFTVRVSSRWDVEVHPYYQKQEHTTQSNGTHG